MRTGRRALVALAVLAPARAAAQDGFPPVAEVAGRRLVLNGTGSRRYLGFEVYRAALYLEARSTDADAILASPGAKLVDVRYRHAVGVDGVSAAWEDSFARACRCPVPEAFRHWLRPIAAGDAERYLFIGPDAYLWASGGAEARIPGASRTLLSAWLAPGVAPDGLRRGLLGA